LSTPFRRALPAGLIAACAASGLASGGAQAAAARELVAVPPAALEIRDGAAVVARVDLKTPALRRGTPRLRELDVDGHHIAEVRVPVRGVPAEEVWIGELGAGAPAQRPPVVIWSGVTGPRDADGEVMTELDVSPARIVEYQ